MPAAVGDGLGDAGFEFAGGVEVIAGVPAVFVIGRLGLPG
jgi:hypothetical protein